ncbi:hypothetical protein [Nitratireductor sp. GCM10026969]|uniref:hypothetical protein n=1 Tax=Nitratireductor sp. GCM10026969 TaxID=3252645 RepID=UPI00360A80B7
MSETMDKVKVELVASNFLTRYPCALGGCTEKDPILCEVTEGPYEGFRVSAEYLRDHTDVDTDLEEAAVAAEDRAAKTLTYAKALRDLKGRLVLPSYDEWREAMRKHEEEYIAERLASQRSWLAELQEMKAEGCDVDAKISTVEVDIAYLEGEPLTAMPAPAGWRPWHTEAA